MALFVGAMLMARTKKEAIWILVAGLSGQWLRGAVGWPLATPDSVHSCYVVERSFGFFYGVLVGEGGDRLWVFPAAVRLGVGSPLSSGPATSLIA